MDQFHQMSALHAPFDGLLVAPCMTLWLHMELVTWTQWTASGRLLTQLTDTQGLKYHTLPIMPNSNLLPKALQMCPQPILDAAQVPLMAYSYGYTASNSCCNREFACVRNIHLTLSCVRHTIKRREGTDPRQCPCSPALISCCSLAFLIKTPSTRSTSLVRNSMSAWLRMEFWWSHAIIVWTRFQFCAWGKGTALYSFCASHDFIHVLHVFRAHHGQLWKKRPWLSLKRKKRFLVSVRAIQANGQQKVQCLLIISWANVDLTAEWFSCITSSSSASVFDRCWSLWLGASSDAEGKLMIVASHDARQQEMHTAVANNCCTCRKVCAWNVLVRS